MAIARWVVYRDSDGRVLRYGWVGAANDLGTVVAGETAVEDETVFTKHKNYYWDGDSFEIEGDKGNAVVPPGDRTPAADLEDAGAGWAVTVNAVAGPDATNPELRIRTALDAAESGAGRRVVQVPTGAVALRITTTFRALVAPGAPKTVVTKVYGRQMNATIGSWSSATKLTDTAIGTNTNWYTAVTEVPITDLNLVAEQGAMLQVTRDPTHANDDLAATAVWRDVDFGWI